MALWQFSIWQSWLVRDLSAKHDTCKQRKLNQFADSGLRVCGEGVLGRQDMWAWVLCATTITTTTMTPTRLHKALLLQPCDLEPGRRQTASTLRGHPCSHPVHKEHVRCNPDVVQLMETTVVSLGVHTQCNSRSSTAANNGRDSHFLRRDASRVCVGGGLRRVVGVCPTMTTTTAA